MDVDDLGPENVPFRVGLVGAGLAFLMGLGITIFVGLVGTGSVLPVGSLAVYWSLHYWPLVVGGIGASIAFTLLPIGALVTSGYWVAKRSGVTGWFAVGGAVTTGYLPLSLLSHGVLYGSVPVIPVLISGVLVPLSFAGLGGAIAELE